VLKFDSDPEDGIPAGPINLAGVAVNGTATLDGQQVLFTHQGEAGPGSFQYQVRDSAGSFSEPATVTVEISLINDPPIAAADAASTAKGVAVDIDVLANDSDVDGALDPATLALATAPGQGSAMVLPGGAGIRYLPSAGFAGVDSFTYTVTDDGAPAPPQASAPGAVTVVVGEVPFAACGPFGRRVVAGIPALLDASDQFTGTGLDFQVTGLPASLVIDGSGIITGTPLVEDVAGSPYPVEITAADGNGIQSFSFLLTVDALPEVVQFADFEEGCFDS